MVEKTQENKEKAQSSSIFQPSQGGIFGSQPKIDSAFKPVASGYFGSSKIDGVPQSAPKLGLFGAPASAEVSEDSSGKPNPFSSHAISKPETATAPKLGLFGDPAPTTQALFGGPAQPLATTESSISIFGGPVKKPVVGATLFDTPAKGIFAAQPKAEGGFIPVKSGIFGGTAASGIFTQEPKTGHFQPIKSNIFGSGLDLEKAQATAAATPEKTKSKIEDTKAEPLFKTISGGTFGGQSAPTLKPAETATEPMFKPISGGTFGDKSLAQLDTAVKQTDSTAEPLFKPISGGSFGGKILHQAPNE